METPLPWKSYWRQNENGEADCGIFWERNPGQAYSVCRAPRYVKKEEWEANAALIVRAVNNFDSLLAALEQIRDGAYDNAHDPKAAARIAAAAIAKAKGS